MTESRAELLSALLAERFGPDARLIREEPIMSDTDSTTAAWPAVPTPDLAALLERFGDYYAAAYVEQTDRADARRNEAAAAITEAFDALTADLATIRAVAASNKRHVEAMAQELETVTASRNEVRELAARRESELIYLREQVTELTRTLAASSTHHPRHQPAEYPATCVRCSIDAHGDEVVELKRQRDRLQAAVDGTGECTCRHYGGPDGEYGGTDEDGLCPRHGTVAVLRGSHEYARRSDAILARALGGDWDEPFPPGHLAEEAARRLDAAPAVQPEAVTSTPTASVPHQPRTVRRAVDSVEVCASCGELWPCTPTATADGDHCGLCGSEDCPGKPGTGCMPGPFELAVASIGEQAAPTCPRCGEPDPMNWHGEGEHCERGRQGYADWRAVGHDLTGFPKLSPAAAAPTIGQDASAEPGQEAAAMEAAFDAFKARILDSNDLVFNDGKAAS